MCIELIDKIVPKNSGSFAMVSDEHIEGGWRVVANSGSRDAIPSSRRKTGMRVYVQDEEKAYELSGSNWNEVAGGGIQASDDVDWTGDHSFLGELQSPGPGLNQFKMGLSASIGAQSFDSMVIGNGASIEDINPEAICIGA